MRACSATVGGGRPAALAQAAAAAGGDERGASRRTAGPATGRLTWAASFRRPGPRGSSARRRRGRARRLRLRPAGPCARSRAPRARGRGGFRTSPRWSSTTALAPCLSTARRRICSASSTRSRRNMGPAQAVEVGAVLGVEGHGLLDELQRLVHPHAAVGVHVAQVVEDGRGVGLDGERLAEDGLRVVAALLAAPAPRRAGTACAGSSAPPRAPCAACARRPGSAWPAGRSRPPGHEHVHVVRATSGRSASMAATAASTSPRARRTLASSRREVGVVGEASRAPPAPRSAPSRGPWPGRALRRIARGGSRPRARRWPRRGRRHPRPRGSARAAGRRSPRWTRKTRSVPAVSSACSPARDRARSASSAVAAPAKSRRASSDRDLEVGGLEVACGPGRGALPRWPPPCRTRACRAGRGPAGRGRSGSSDRRPGRLPPPPAPPDSGARGRAPRPGPGAGGRSRAPARGPCGSSGWPGRSAGRARRCRRGPGRRATEDGSSSSAFCSAAAALSASPRAR